MLTLLEQRLLVTLKAKSARYQAAIDKGLIEKGERPTFQLPSAKPDNILIIKKSIK